MTLSWLPIQNDLVPQKFTKILSTISIMVVVAQNFPSHFINITQPQDSWNSRSN